MFKVSEGDQRELSESARQLEIGELQPDDAPFHDIDTLPVLQRIGCAPSRGGIGIELLSVVSKQVECQERFAVLN